MKEFISGNNRVKTNEWDFNGDFNNTVKKLDRYFYVNYTSELLAEVEKMRMLTGKKGLFGFAKKASGSQFILEYEGIHGINKLGGHRQKMTDRINKVFYLITRENPKKGKDNDRHLINSKILETPFGGLEVASLIMTLFNSYEQLSKHQTDKLTNIYKLEISKWIFYWTISSYSLNKIELYDIFNVNNRSPIFSGTVSKKISDLIDFSKKCSNDNNQYLFRFYILSYLTQAQDFLLQKEEELTEPECLYEKKVLIDMLMKQLLFFIDRTEKKKLSLTTHEQRMLFIFYPYHPMRIKKTVAYFLTKRSARQLAWQLKIVPDENFYWIIGSLDDRGKKMLLKELKNIAKIKKNSSERENLLINKLETKIKKISAKSTLTPQAPGVATVRVLPNTTSENIAANEQKSDQKPLETANRDRLDILLETPFIVDVQFVDTNSKNVCASNLMQVLSFKHKNIFLQTVHFVTKTGQLHIDKTDLIQLWKQKETIQTEKLSPLERLTYKDLCRSLTGNTYSNWKEIVPFLYVKVGESASDLKKYEQHILAILEQTFIRAKEKWEGINEENELLGKPFKEFHSWIKDLTSQGIILPDEMLSLTHCWKSCHYRSEENKSVE